MVIDISSKLKEKPQNVGKPPKNRGLVIQLHTPKEIEDRVQAQKDHDALLRRAQEQADSGVIPFGTYVDME